MIGTAVLDWLHRRDPEHRIGLRALRLTVIALPSYYVCLYGLGNPILATYVIFGVIASGLFITLPGPAGRRAAALLTALPAAVALVVLATLLDRRTLWAVAATFIIGFSIAFFGVGGPRLVGLASGLQLFYIVAVFPPQHANALPARVAGSAVGLVLVALGEVLLWPDPTPVPYQRRLAEAMNTVAELLDSSANALAGRPGGDEDTARLRDRVAESVESVRLAGFPRTERPTSASRRDRALRDCASITRELAEQVQRLGSRPQLRYRRDDDMAAWLSECAETVRHAVRILVGEEPPEAADVLGDRVPGPGRGAIPLPEGPDFDRLRLWTSLQSIAEHVRSLAAGSAIAIGRTAPFQRGQRFWYARHSDVLLFWRQLRLHLTPRSVYFQGALRLAVALAAARLVAAELRLSHGFWVLLGTLTVMRTSAFNTRVSLVSAAFGTLIGAVAAGLLLRYAFGPVPFAFEFLVATLLAFAVGPLLGLLWGQAALTVMITLVFAQLGPANLGLARTRLVDVVIGGAIGVVAGLVMWPRGAGGEVRRRVASYLRVDADLIEETVATLAGREGYRELAPKSLRAARHEYVLADASLCLYFLERPDARMSQVHWDASMVAGHHVVHGAEVLLDSDPPGALACWPEATTALSEVALALRGGYLDIAAQLPEGRISRPVTTPTNGQAIGDQAAAVIAAGGGRPEDSRLVEIADWLIDLSENLDWIQTASGSPLTGPARPGPARPRSA